MDLFRDIMASLDATVYYLIEQAYGVLLEIANVLIVTPQNAAEFAGKIYTLLGIFMVFKITFSLINYLVNPDLMSDKAKGAGKIATNVVIVLVLIIITPTAFQKLYELQSAIIEDDVIPRFILGTEEDGTGINQVAFSPEYCEDVVITASNDGTYLSLLIFRSFFQPDEMYSVEEFKSSAVYEKYCNSSYNSVYDFLSADAYNKSSSVFNNRYYIKYSILVSTAVGIFILLILVSFCFDIAIRSIKLSFLQIIAPIPIISYIDPDSGKNGMFKKWLKMVGSTWADLFIRLIAIFFALYIINLLGGDGNMLNGLDGSEAEISHSIWVRLFIIIGALMFAKKLPSIITDLTGIKLGGMELNPLKKIEKDAVGGKLISRAGVGLTTAGLVSGATALTNAYARKKEGASTGKILRSAAGGFFGGASRGMVGGFKGNKLGKNLATTYDGTRDKRIQRDGWTEKGSTILDRFEGNVKNKLGVPSEAKIQDLEASQYGEFLKVQKAAEEKSETELNKLSSYVIKNGFDYKDENGKSTPLAAGQNYATLKADYERVSSDPNAKAVDRILANSKFQAAKKAAKLQYIDDSLIGKGHPDIKAYFDKATEIQRINKDLEEFKKVGTVTNADELDAAKKAISDAKVKLENSTKWEKAHANAQITKEKK